MSTEPKERCAGCGTTDARFYYGYEDATVCVKCAAELDAADVSPVVRAPDANCITTADGGCESIAHCMHTQAPGPRGLAELPDGWEREAKVSCVVAPCCGFTFDERHGTESCPLCEPDPALRERHTTLLSAVRDEEVAYMAYHKAPPGVSALAVREEWMAARARLRALAAASPGSLAQENGT